MYTFLVYLITFIIIGLFLFFLFRRPKIDAEYDEVAQAMDKIEQERDKIPEQQKWNQL